MTSQVRFLTIASSSRGNAHAVEAEGHLFLVDCGVAPRAVAQGLELLGKSLEEVEAIFVSHTHTDHVAGLWSMLRKASPQVYGPKSLGADVLKYGGKFFPLSDGEFSVNGYKCAAFKLSHDCEPTFGFRLEICGKAISVATDLGEWTGDVLDSIEGSDVLVWEANHDEELLWNGRYPANLKKRITGAKGHLSNEQAVSGVEELSELPSRLFLGHLSRENNSIGRVMDTFEGRHLDKHMKIEVLDPYGCGEVILV